MSSLGPSSGVFVPSQRHQPDWIGTHQRCPLYVHHLSKGPVFGRSLGVKTSTWQFGGHTTHNTLKGTGLDCSPPTHWETESPRANDSPGPVSSTWLGHVLFMARQSSSRHQPRRPGVQNVPLPRGRVPSPQAHLISRRGLARAGPQARSPTPHYIMSSP